MRLPSDRRSLAALGMTWWGVTIFLYKMSCLHHGIAFLPYYLCSDALKDKMLVKVLPDWLNVDNEYYMIYHKDKSVLYINQLFKDFILQSDLNKMILD